MSAYTRVDLLRILRITPRQLSSWERAGLVASAEQYSFADLLQIKKIDELCAKRVRPATIRQSLEAMQKQVSGMSNPLLEATAFSSGSRVAFRHKGKVMEPVSGQFVMDFAADADGMQALASMRVEGNLAASPKRQAIERMKEQQVDAAISDLFSHGIALEEDPARQAEAAVDGRPFVWLVGFAPSLGAPSSLRRDLIGPAEVLTSAPFLSPALAACRIIPA